MTTLLLRTHGLQSWGTRSHWNLRDTERTPTKSGVLGMIARCLGLDRSAPVDRLMALRMGCRADRPGLPVTDFQTAQDVETAESTPTKRRTKNVISWRDALADASFLVGLEGEVELLVDIETALRQPVWAPYLGRKNHPPALPLFLPGGGLREIDLVQALSTEPLYVWRPDTSGPRLVRAEIEVPGPEDGATQRNDALAPGATWATRHYQPRWVRTEQWRLEGEGTASLGLNLRTAAA
jgi:CRISPR system Cascade subunit CasD